MTRIGYEVEVKSSQVDEALSLFNFLGGNSADAFRVAINKTGPLVTTKASAAIRAQVNLKAAFVKDQLTFTRATRANLSARISATSRGILLRRYSTDSNINGDKVSWLRPPPVPKRGPRVRVKTGGPIKGVAGKPGEVVGKPFYMVLKNSRALGIVARRAGGGFKVFYAPSVSQVFNTVRDDVLPEAGEIYEKQMLDAIRFLLVKQFPK